MTKKKNSNLPAFTVRIGLIRGSVWANAANGNTYYTTSIVRRYKDGDEYKETSTYSGVGDLLACGEIARRCGEFIHNAEQQTEVDAAGEGKADE